MKVGSNRFGHAGSGLSRRALLRNGAGFAGASLLGGAGLPSTAFAATTINVEIDAGQNEAPFH